MLPYQLYPKQSILPQVAPTDDVALSLTQSPNATSSMQGRSCLGPELLSQLAGLDLDAAELQRNHPPMTAVLSAVQASHDCQHSCC